MAAVEELGEVAGLAALAGGVTRSAAWTDRDAVDRALRRVDRSIASDREESSRPAPAAARPSADWQSRLLDILDPSRDEHTDPPPADPEGAALRAEADAQAAVTVARLALREAQRAVLESRAAALRALALDPACIGPTRADGADTRLAAAVRIPLAHRLLPPGHPIRAHARAVTEGVAHEFSALLRDRPRPILTKLAVGLGLGLAYLGYLRLFRWDDKEEVMPYLALYALSGVIGGVVCTNALCWDAGRVRAALVGGRRLWQLLLAKNITLFVLVGAVGLVLSGLLAWRAGEPAALLKAVGQLITMMLIWLGIGNVLSVVSPLRVEPLEARRQDGTLRPFLLSFVSSYVVGLGVNLMLTWRVWAKQSMIAELGGPLVPVLTLVGSALVSYLLLTVLAVSLTERPRVRRTLLREMIDHRATVRTPALP
ncbi:hypothetical protein JL107_09960 [Nakamurella flavida]|uniref:Uncharacterized protein n=1 Tax=Nakamurella flavida TaxID=363630 RepID=A0A938YKD0_9ACTN|nr:hypothetical protein [Nakamurella flavida]MBM9476769.1 hypothetical protein [Nakamurella flavida]MDP9778793.1 hypothetical protein [Nakamurella flavida]